MVGLRGFLVMEWKKTFFRLKGLVNFSGESVDSFLAL